MEGTAASLDELYARIAKDPRHADLKLLRRENIPALQYEDWAMKYAANDAQVQVLLARSGRSGFDPYSFDEAMISDMLQVLRLGAEAILLEPVSQASTREEGSTRDPRTSLALWLAGGALAVSVAALAVSLSG